MPETPGPCSGGSRDTFLSPKRNVPPYASRQLNVGAQEMHVLCLRMVVAAAFSAFACVGAWAGGSPAPSVGDQSPRSAMTLELGKAAVSDLEGLTVELLSVKDHRCAIEVLCIWAGHAEATLRVSKPGTATQTVVVSTLAPATTRLAFEATSGSHRLVLVDLSPRNLLLKPVAQALYRATVQVTKL